MSGDTPLTTPPTGVARRSDARRNHERIIAAAVEVFAEKGIDATIPEIAARAGVGKATVYRNYPTKDDLVAAVARQRLRWILDRTERFADEDDALAGLRQYTEDVLIHLKDDRSLSQTLSAALIRDTSAETAALRRQVRDRLGSIVQSAQEQGTLRSDATYDDFRLLVTGVAEQLHREGVADGEAWRRYAGLVVDALRTTPPHGSATDREG